MITLRVDTSSLLQWARYLNRVPKETKTSVARGLNALGDGVVRDMVGKLAGRTGLDPHTVHSLLRVTRATPSRLVWEVDTSALTPEELDRRMARRAAPRGREGVIREGTLVNIVSMEDDSVCFICQDAVENGPYTIEEVNALQARNVYGGGLLHPNCRCMIQEVRRLRRVAMERQGRTQTGSLEWGNVQEYSLKQLADDVIRQAAMRIQAR